MAVPFVPSHSTVSNALAGQVDGLNLSVYAWDASSQAWSVGQHLVSSGWVGNVISLLPAQPLLLATESNSSVRVSLTGWLPAANLEQTLSPGLNLVASPRWESTPLYAWSWDLDGGQAGLSNQVADLVYTISNQEQAWLRLDGTNAVWTGFADPQEPGTLSQESAAWYLHRGTNSFAASGEVSAFFDSNARPAIVGVEYLPALDGVRLAVATDGGTNRLELYYQDIAFPDPIDFVDGWRVWALDLRPGSGNLFEFNDSGSADRPAPSVPSVRLYQVVDALADADGDLFSDFYETYIQGTDPNAFNATPGNVTNLTRQVWWGLSGSTVAHLTSSPRFPWEPDLSHTLSPFFDTPRNQGNSYGQRVIGRFHPPLSGLYTFRITSDNDSELWLTREGVSERIAWVNGYASPSQWTKYASQISSSFYLEAGREYPVEARMKQNTGNNHLLVGIHFPTHTLEAPVRSKWFDPPVPVGVADTDGDGMPDTWETVYGLSPTDAGDATGDMSGDGLQNLETYRLGLAPDRFYPLPGNVTALTELVWWNVSGATVGHLTSAPGFPFHPNTTNVFSGVEDRFTRPVNIANNFGRRVMGRFHAPLSGEHVFWIASDDRSELWLPDHAPSAPIAEVPGYSSVHQWDKYLQQESVGVPLLRGTAYPLDALMKENTGNDHLAVGVRLPDMRFERPVRARRFLQPPTGVSFTLDTDGDGLSDYEEWVVGTDSEAADTSGDGISDFDALALNLDPLAPHPPPLLPASWVLAHAINSAAAYIYEDFDGDGLSNIEEYHHGTNPRLWDSSGDGVSDLEAALLFRVDPLLPLFDGSRHTVASLNGAVGQGVSGVWTPTVAGSLFANSRQGSVSFQVPVATGGVYAILFDLQAHTHHGQGEQFTLETTVNGLEAGRRPVHIAEAQPSEVLFVSPWLEPGTHTVLLRVQNLVPETYLEIHSVRVVEIGGPDGNQDGVADWMTQRVAAALSPNLPMESAVSPVCVEGRAAFPASVRLVSSVDPQQVVHAEPGVLDGWYANVHLLAGTDTALVISEAHASQAVTSSVTWVETALLPALADPLLLRPGDALRLGARPDGATNGLTTLTINGVPGAPFPFDQAEPHTFEDAGEYWVVAEWTDGIVVESSTNLIRVIAAGLTASPFLLPGRTVQWDQPNLPTELFLEVDPHVLLTEATLAPSGRRLTVRVGDTVPRRLLARLGAADGPVAAAVTLHGVETALGTSYRVLEALPDGTRIIELTVAFSSVPPDLRITLISKSGGLSFEDGSKNYTLTAADVGSDGVLRYRMFQAPLNNDRVCHDLQFSYAP